MGNLTFLANYGETRVEKPTPAAETTTEFTRYAANAGDKSLTVTIFNRACTDTMSGMPYPKTVVAVFGEQELKGCGGDPAELLKGGEWLVGDIDAWCRHRRTLARDAQLPGGWAYRGHCSCNTYVEASTP